MDRDRMDLESVPSLRQTGKFLLADQGGAVVGCVYVELKAERGLLGFVVSRSRASEGRRRIQADERRRG